MTISIVEEELPEEEVIAILGDVEENFGIIVDEDELTKVCQARASVSVLTIRLINGERS